tara:strand:- start:799 stop:2523 length:1725 start_codon:yes stop_codon:yes gene_type:complete
MITQADAANYDAVWLLDVEIDGRTYRYTSAASAQQVTTDTGLSYLYAAGMSDLRLTSANDAAAVQIIDGTDWAALFSAGASMEGGRATLRRWWSGLTHEQAHVWATGNARGAEYGERGEPLIFTIESGASVDTDFLMPANSAAYRPLHYGPDRAGGPTYDIYPESEGLPLPIVIGYPGDLGDDNSLAVVPIVLTDWPTSGVPAATDLDTSRCSVSIGRIDATTVYVKERDKFPNGPTYTATIQHATQATVSNAEETTYDVAYIDFSGNDSAGNPSRSILPATVDSDSKAAFYAGFKPSTGGGLSNPYAPGTLSGAGDVIIWALRTCGASMRVDYDRLQELRPVLNNYRIDTFINDTELRALDWLRSVVLSILPVVETTTDNGWSLAYLDWCASEADALGTLVADRDVFRASSARVINAGDLVSEVTVTFRSRESAGYPAHADRTIVNPDLYVKRDRSALVGQPNNYYPDRIAKISAARYGLRKTEIELDQTWEDATALRIARDVLKAQGLAILGVTYQAATDTLERARVGDVWLLTDEGMGWTERIAIVTEINVGGNEPPALTFALPDPLLKRV